MHNNASTYSWLDVLLAIFMALQIRRYYYRHKQIYLCVYHNKVQQINRYLATPEYFKDSKIQEIIQLANKAIAQGHLSGLAASLASISYSRLDGVAAKMIKSGARKWYYLDTFILLSIVLYAITTIWLIAKDLLG